MGVFTYETEIVITMPPAKMFKAFVLGGDKLIPKVVHQAIKSVEILEGDGGPGIIKKITFGEGSQFKYVKHQVEAVDKDNFISSYSIIEADALMGTLEEITYKTKIVASLYGVSICKNTSKYYTVGEIVIKEEEIKAGKEKALGLFKAIEAYLLANLDTY